MNFAFDYDGCANGDVPTSRQAKQASKTITHPVNTAMKITSQEFITAFDMTVSFIWGFFAKDSSKIEAMRDATIKLLDLSMRTYKWSSDGAFLNNANYLLQTSLQASFLEPNGAVGLVVEDGGLKATARRKYAGDTLTVALWCNVSKELLSIHVYRSADLVYEFKDHFKNLPNGDEVVKLETGFSLEHGDPLKVALFYLLIAVARRNVHQPDYNT